LPLNELAVGQLNRPVLARGDKPQAYDNDPMSIQTAPPPRLNTKLDAVELTLLQELATAELPQLYAMLPQQPENLFSQKSVNKVWVKVERVLREYAQYHFGRSIRSAALVDALSIPDL
jgi:DNA repair protein RecO (recombination protein O)